MNKLTLDMHSPEILKFSGELDYTAITPGLWEQCRAWITQASSVMQVDLGGVSHSDSTGVAFVMALIKLARKENKKLSFIHLPEQMLAIIRLTNLEKFI